MHRIGCSSFTRLLLAVSFLFWLTACHKWVPVEGSPASALRELADQVGPEQDKVRLHLARDVTLEGWVAGIVGDTALIQTRKVGLDNETVPIRHVLRLDVREPNPLATAGLVLVSLAAVAAVVLTVLVLTWPSES